MQCETKCNMTCLCFMERLGLSTRDHNASGVDPGCFMVYNRFKFHGFITNNKCKLFLRALSFTYCTSEVTLTLASRLRKQILLSDRTRANVSFIFIIDRFETSVYKKIFSRQLCSYRILLTLLKTGFLKWSYANRLNSDILKCGLLMSSPS